MKRILNSRRQHYLARFSILWIMVALIVVTVGCAKVAEYSLTMAVNPVGCGTATDLTGGSPYIESRVVSIEAVAAAGYQFVSWAAPAGGFSNANAAVTTFIMPDEDVTVTANFGPCKFKGGSGTAGDPYQIADWCQLHNVRNYLDSSFILVNDLNSATPGYSELASSTANGGKGWPPIGGGLDAHCTPIAVFTGTFDGQGHEIRDLFINRPDENAVGLFGFAYGLIENVGVVNANVTGGCSVGILGNGCNMRRCYSSGSVSGSDGVGGLIGGCIGNISDSYSTAYVSGGYAVSSCTVGVGGLVGENEGTISDCYAMGSVAGVGKVGGLVGWNYANKTVERSYAAAIVTGTGNVGGLVGLNEGTVSNSFWDTGTSGQATSAGGTGKTTAEMTSMATFSGANWNIITVTDRGIRDVAFIWNIVNGVYPFLSWEPV